MGRKEGRCPFCNYMIKYANLKHTKNECYYPVICPNCKAEGKEYYELKFATLIMEKEEGICTTVKDVSAHPKKTV